MLYDYDTYTECNKSLGCLFYSKFRQALHDLQSRICQVSLRMKVEQTSAVTYPVRVRS